MMEVDRVEVMVLGMEVKVVMGQKYTQYSLSILGNKTILCIICIIHNSPNKVGSRKSQASSK